MADLNFDPDLDELSPTHSGEELQMLWGNDLPASLGNFERVTARDDRFVFERDMQQADAQFKGDLTDTFPTKRIVVSKESDGKWQTTVKTYDNGEVTDVTVVDEADEKYDALAYANAVTSELKPSFTRETKIVKNWHTQRTREAQVADESFRAVRENHNAIEWLQHPNRYDYVGVDTIPKERKNQRTQQAADRLQELGAVGEVEEVAGLTGNVRGIEGTTNLNAIHSPNRYGGSRVAVEANLPDRKKHKTLAHELGHNIDWSASPARSKGKHISKHAAESNELDDEAREQLRKESIRRRGDYAPDDEYRALPTEEAADFLGTAIEQPRYAKAKHPEAYSLFEEQARQAAEAQAESEAYRAKISVSRKIGDELDDADFEGWDHTDFEDVDKLQSEVAEAAAERVREQMLPEETSATRPEELVAIAEGGSKPQNVYEFAPKEPIAELEELTGTEISLPNSF